MIKDLLRRWLLCLASRLRRRGPKPTRPLHIDSRVVWERWPDTWQVISQEGYRVGFEAGREEGVRSERQRSFCLAAFAVTHGGLDTALLDGIQGGLDYLRTAEIFTEKLAADSAQRIWDGAVKNGPDESPLKD